MSAARPTTTFPTWRGMATRPMWQDGSDVCRSYDSWLGAKIADTVIFRELSRDTITPSEAPGCWSASFRGAMTQLNLNLWSLNIQQAVLEKRLIAPTN